MFKLIPNEVFNYVILSYLNMNNKLKLCCIIPIKFSKKEYRKIYSKLCNLRPKRFCYDEYFVPICFYYKKIRNIECWNEIVLRRMLNENKLDKERYAKLIKKYVFCLQSSPNKKHKLMVKFILNKII